GEQNADESIRFQWVALDNELPAIGFGQTVSADLENGTDIYRLQAWAGDGFRYISPEATSAAAQWCLYSASGSLLRSGLAGTSDSATYRLPSTGGYYLMFSDPSGDATGAQPFQFELDANRIDLDSLVTGTFGYSTTNYQLLVDESQWIQFDFFKATYAYQDNFQHWSVVREDGTLAGSGYAYSGEKSVWVEPGTYRVQIWSDYYNNVGAQFVVRSPEAASLMSMGETTTVSLAPGNTTAIYRFDAATNEVFAWDLKQSFTGEWRILGPEGQLVRSGSGSSDTFTQLLTVAGKYLLVLDGRGYSAQSFSFVGGFAEDKGNLTLNALTEASLEVGQVQQFWVHLDAESLLAFDSLGLAQTGLKWQLRNASGLVFAQDIGSSSTYWYDPRSASYRYINDFAGYLAAGEYSLVLTNTGTAPAQASFRVLDTSQATTITPGSALTTQMTPLRSSALYTFQAQAGESYYFDVVSSAVNTNNLYGPSSFKWTLLGPNGKTVFSDQDMAHHNYWSSTFNDYDSEPAAFALTGTYTLVIEQRNNTTTTSPQLTFNVVKVPDNPVVVLDTLLVRPAPDLVVNDLVLTPSELVQTGDLLNIQWIVENRGTLPTDGNWNDRVLVRNLDTGELVASLTLPYDPATDGVIGLNESR
ncbi:MAG: hypothetical protein U1E02_28005, partial [Hydrogenophaga sp.]|nr:hypothetical protein [Hydrogenophaga sp.]